jgi:Glycosyl hydrolase catalytic core
VASYGIPSSSFHGRQFDVGDLFGLGTYAAMRYPGIARPALYRAHLTGADWVREEFTADRLHLGTNAPYQWWRTNAVVGLERRFGFHILGLLDYNNTFGPHTHGFMPHWTLRRYVADFVRYVQAIVKHYHNSIHAWQIWNEPDLNRFWSPRANPEDYAHLLTASYRAIKAIDRHATVVLGGPAGTDQHPLRFIWRVVSAGGKFDVVSIQPYRDAPDMQLLHEVVSLRRYHKPVWFTEMGWAGGRLCVATCGDVDSQADRLARLYVVSVLGHVQHVFWYDLRDDGTGPGFEDHFGILDSTLAAKPAFLAYELSHFYLNRARFLGVDELQPEVYVFELRKRGVTYYLLLSNRLGACILSIPWRGSIPALALDWAGREVSQSKHQMLQLVASPRSILYLVPQTFIPKTYMPAGVRLENYRIHFTSRIRCHCSSVGIHGSFVNRGMRPRWRCPPKLFPGVYRPRPIGLVSRRPSSMR